MKKAIIAILTISIFCAAFSVKTRAYVGAPPNGSFMSDEMEKTWDPAGFFWLEDTDPYSRQDGNIWKYRKTVRRINEDRSPSKDLSVSGRKLVLSDNSIYEIYENPDTGEVNKVTVIREYWDKNGNSESFRQRSDYYYFNGLPNFEFIREDSSRPMSFPTHSQLGERIYFDRKGGFCRSVLYDEKGCHENTGSSSDDDGKWANMVIAYALGKEETESLEKPKGNNLISVRVLDKTDSYSENFDDVSNTFSYDDNGMLSERITEMRDPTRYVSQSYKFSYDDNCLVNSMETEVKNKDSSNVNKGSIVFSYDEDGHLLSSDEKQGDFSDYLRNDGWSLDMPDTIKSSYSTSVSGNGETVIKKETTDLMGNKTSVEFIFEQTGLIRGWQTLSTEYSLSEHYSYDSRGNVVSGKISDGMDTEDEFVYSYDYFTDGNVEKRKTDRGEVTVYYYKDIDVPVDKVETVKDQQWSLINNNLNMEFPYGIWFSSYDFFNDLYEEYHN